MDAHSKLNKKCSGNVASVILGSYIPLHQLVRREVIVFFPEKTFLKQYHIGGSPVVAGALKRKDIL